MTSRSSEPHTSVCLQLQPSPCPPVSSPVKGYGDCPPPTLNFSPKLCKASDPDPRLGKGQMPSSVGHLTPSSYSPDCQVGTRLNHKLGKGKVWWLVLGILEHGPEAKAACRARHPSWLAQTFPAFPSITVWPSHPSAGTAVG